MGKSERLRAIGGGALVFGVVAQFAAQPLMPFIDPVSFFNGGVLAASGAAMLAIGSIDERRLEAYLGLALVLMGVLIVSPTVLSAAGIASRSRSHCRTIERALLLPPRHVRSDLPAVFTALGCKPQL